MTSITMTVATKDINYLSTVASANNEAYTFTSKSASC